MSDGEFLFYFYSLVLAVFSVWFGYLMGYWRGAEWMGDQWMKSNRRQIDRIIEDIKSK